MDWSRYGHEVSSSKKSEAPVRREPLSFSPKDNSTVFVIFKKIYNLAISFLAIDVLLAELAARRKKNQR